MRTLAAVSTRTVALGAAGGGKIGDVPLEVYVARVLAGEGEPNAPEATQQALAIAIRTYAVFNTGRHKREGFDLCDSVHCQVPRSCKCELTARRAGDCRPHPDLQRGAGGDFLLGVVRRTIRDCVSRVAEYRRHASVSALGERQRARR